MRGIGLSVFAALVTAVIGAAAGQATAQRAPPPSPPAITLPPLPDLWTAKTGNSYFDQAKALWARANARPASDRVLPYGQQFEERLSGGWCRGKTVFVTFWSADRPNQQVIRQLNNCITDGVSIEAASNGQIKVSDIHQFYRQDPKYSSPSRYIAPKPDTASLTFYAEPPSANCVSVQDVTMRWQIGELSDVDLAGYVVCTDSQGVKAEGDFGYIGDSAQLMFSARLGDASWTLRGTGPAGVYNNGAYSAVVAAQWDCAASARCLRAPRSLRRVTLRAAAGSARAGDYIQTHETGALAASISSNAMITPAMADDFGPCPGAPPAPTGWAWGMCRTIASSGIQNGSLYRLAAVGQPYAAGFINEVITFPDLSKPRGTIWRYERGAAPGQLKKTSALGDIVLTPTPHIEGKAELRTTVDRVDPATFVLTAISDERYVGPVRDMAADGQGQCAGADGKFSACEKFNGLAVEVTK